MIDFFLFHLLSGASLNRAPQYPYMLASPIYDCSHETQWRKLIPFVRDDLLRFRVVIVGEATFINVNNNAPIKEIPSTNIDPDPTYPRPITLTQCAIIIENSPELIQLSSIPNEQVLNELIKLLDVPRRGWSAF
jgi:hypothetical protein